MDGWLDGLVDGWTVDKKATFSFFLFKYLNTLYIYIYIEYNNCQNKFLVGLKFGQVGGRLQEFKITG